ncbi:hypothetical protein EC991_003647 [Linnemannia zychae]|nr:hypothetical protein EC991_003647 [Linnemannia zychae]
MPCVGQRSDSTAVDISSLVSVSSGGSVSTDGNGDDLPIGGAGGTEAMAVVKAASMTSSSKGHGGGIYHGGPSKAHMGANSLSSSSSGQKTAKWRAAKSEGIATIVACVAVLWVV